MAITYFGSASTPADNGTSTGTPKAVTPPVSMVVGDLVVMFGYYRGTSTIAVSAAGGQTWTTLVTSSTASGPVLSTFATWCRFNGTWSTDPSLSFSTSSTNTNAVMHVFRPTSSSNTWAIEIAGFRTEASAPSSPFTCTCTVLASDFGSSSLAADANLVGYWKLEDLTATTGGATLTNNNSVTFATGKFNNAADFTGNGGGAKGLTTASGFGINLRTSAATMMCWIKPTTIPGGPSNPFRIFDWRSTTGTPHYMILDHSTNGSSNPGFYFDSAGGFTHYPTILTANQWYHIAMTQPTNTGGTVRLYIDGVEVATNTKGTAGAGDSFSIGNGPTLVDGFAGLIDEVVIFSRELSATEISQMASSAGITHASTVGVGGLFTDDDNTWGTLVGGGWTSAGTAQYRNTSGSDSSSTYAYNIRTTIGDIGSFTKNQATLGGDPYVSISGIFYEIGDARQPRPTSVGHPFIF